VAWVFTSRIDSAVGDHPLGGFHIRFVQRLGGPQMAHPLGALLGQYVPPVGGVPFEGPGGVTFEAFGCSAVGLDLWHLFFL